LPGGLFDMERKPNHTCRNMNCHKGADGGRKQYYACDVCDRTSYRVIACSPECYAEIMRIRNKPVEIRPERSDKTESEINEIMTAPIEEVEKRSREELSDYADKIETMGLEKVVDLINEEIDAEAKS